VVRTSDGALALGRTLPGRGAWLCGASPGCVDRAIKRRAFNRALRAEVGGEEVEGLRTELRSPEVGKEGQGSEAPVP
jgi:predicted RNA-binding protein YlxR (DUF448 family)